MDSVWKAVERRQNDDKIKKLLNDVTEAKDLLEASLIQKEALIEEIEQAREDLELAIKEKDLFFSIIAHDLRSPFSGFLGFTKIMAEEIQDLSIREIQDITKQMQGSANNLYALLENLLQWARMQSGKLIFNPQFASINELIRSNIDLISLRAKIKGIKIDFAEDKEILAEMDVNMIDGVLRNLLSNALKYTNSGGNINISIIDAGSEISVIVRDDGIGMSEKITKNLFTIVNKQSRAGTENETGTGLGLILSKDYIDAHKGRISVHSSVNLGSSFIFTIPKNLQFN
jgi:signal transduction histidine kinase